MLSLYLDGKKIFTDIHYLIIEKNKIQIQNMTNDIYHYLCFLFKKQKIYDKKLFLQIYNNDNIFYECFVFLENINKSIFFKHGDYNTIFFLKFKRGDL